MKRILYTQTETIVPLRMEYLINKKIKNPLTLLSVIKKKSTNYLSGHFGDREPKITT